MHLCICIGSKTEQLHNCTTGQLHNCTVARIHKYTRMSDTVIKVENLSKLYRLGEVGTGTLSHDLNRWFAKILGKEDPLAKVGRINDRTQRAEKDEYIWALKDINFEVKQGEVLGIIGKNGAGKSTLLKILSRITAPTTGEVKIKGRVGSLLEVGTGFHPEMTGRENIFINGTILGMTRKEITTKLDDIVEFAGVAKYLDTPVKRYSSGMMVRLGFAVAAFLEPEILIVDEVLAVGDAEFQKKALGKMQEVSKGEGRTVLFVSHNMVSISYLCTSGILINNGKISYSGKTEEVISRYIENNNTLAGIELADRTDRSGNGDVIVKRISILDGRSKKKIDRIVAGQDVIIEIYYESRTKDSIKNFNIGLGVFEKNGIFICVLNNMMSNYFFRDLPSTGVVYCKIPRFPLMSGPFSLTVTLQVNNVLVDQVQNAISVLVEEGDYYGSRNSNAFGRQGVYIEQNWSALL